MAQTNFEGTLYVDARYLISGVEMIRAGRRSELDEGPDGDLWRQVQRIVKLEWIKSHLAEAQAAVAKVFARRAKGPPSQAWGWGHVAHEHHLQSNNGMRGDPATC